MAKKKAKKAAKKAAAKAPAGDKAQTKSQILGALAEKSGLKRKEVAGIFEDLAAMIKKDLSKKGPGTFTIPGLIKLRVRRKPATKARKGINPFTGEETTFAAKPARNVVKALPLKALKDMV